MLVQTMNNARMDSKDIVNNVGVFNEGVVMSSIFRESYWGEHYFLQILLG